MNDLLDAARAVRVRAHAPYSGFQVGAALRDEAGRVHLGCNVENAAYPQAQCAEAGAIAALVAAGGRRILEVAVVGGGEAPCTPCGGCRQRLAEFAGGAVPVHMTAERGPVLTMTLGELLPAAFRLHVPAGDAVGASPAEATLRRWVAERRPRLGIVLGSGLQAVADGIEDAVTLAYADLPGLPSPGVAGHAGRLILGHLGGAPVLTFSGRVHAYEGRPGVELAALPRFLRGLGCTGILLTNAAGSLRPEHGAGSLVAITDHIDLTGRNPLVGRNDDAVGPRFPDLQDLYDPGLRALLHGAADALGQTLGAGVYLATTGPSFETPAEIRAMRVLGADLVGMSTVPEAIAARHCGLRVLGLSLVTNLAAGMAGQRLDHAHTLAQGEAAGQRVLALLRRAVPELHDALGPD